MDSLVVNGKFLVAIGNDEDTDQAGAIAVCGLDLVAKATLVNDLQAGLEVTSLGHGDERTALGDVNDAVFLVDGAEHRVEDDGRRRVRDDARFLVELTGEEINTEVTMLTSGSRGGDADDLAGALLEDDDITDTDVVARDRVGGGIVGSTTAGGGSSDDTAGTTSTARDALGGRDVDTVDLLDGLARNAGRRIVEGVEDVVKGGTKSLKVVSVHIGVTRATHFL